MVGSGLGHVLYMCTWPFWDWGFADECVQWTLRRRSRCSGSELWLRDRGRGGSGRRGAEERNDEQ